MNSREGSEGTLTWVWELGAVRLELAPLLHVACFIAAIRWAVLRDPVGCDYVERAGAVKEDLLPGKGSKRVFSTSENTAGDLLEGYLSNSAWLVGAFEYRVGAVRSNEFGARPSAGDDITDRAFGSIVECPVFVCSLECQLW